MRFEVGRLIGQVGVGRGVRLAEAEPGKQAEEFENLGCLFGRHAVFDRSRQKLSAEFFIRPVQSFLGDSAAEKVGGGQIESRNSSRAQQHLFLVYEYAMRFLEDRFETRVGIYRRLFTMMPVEEDLFHPGVRSTRPDQRQSQGDIVQFRGFEVAQKCPQTGRLDLKHPYGFARPQQFVSFWILIGNGEILALDPFGMLHAVDDDGQSALAQDVDFDQADFFGLVHVALSHDQTLGRPFQRHIIGQRRRRDDNPPG